MYLRSTLLLFWAGVCAASVAAAVLVVAAEVCTAPRDLSASAVTRACRATAGAGAPSRFGTAFIPALSASLE
jgi:hypothetical protein